MDENDLLEFKQEAFELLDNAESAILNISEDNFSKTYAIVFRSLHSLKGAAGMLGLDALQHHVHQLEDIFQGYRQVEKLTKDECDFFLKGIDASRDLLNGKPIQFKYRIDNETSSKQNQDKGELETKECLVFVIDDEPDIVEIISEILKKQNYIVRGFTNPLLAVQRLPVERPDLVLTDLMMPELNGKEVLKAVKNFSCNIPVIFISGNINSDLLISAIQYNIDAVVEKPIDEFQLLLLISEILNKFEVINLANRTIDLILFQFQDLHDYLLKNNKKLKANILKEDIQTILKAQREIKAKNGLLRS